MAYVLVVDDDADGREVLAVYLRKLGHRVGDASDGEQALRMLVVERPDLLILDLRMPDVDGLKLLEVMRSYLRWHSFPVIMLTGLATPDQIARAEGLGVERVFQKSSFKFSDLVNAVNEVLGTAPQ
jgi:CheY-like chemotaxis protein